jgi:hypothetical protein
MQDLLGPGGQPACLPPVLLEGGQIDGRVLGSAQDGPEDGEQEGEGADAEGEEDGEGDAVVGFGSDAGVVEDPGEEVGEGGSQSDEEALHEESGGALCEGEFVGDKGAEGLHADIDAGVEDPEQCGGDPECG